MDHKVSKDMISSGMIPSGEKTQADLGRTQYGSAPSPNALLDAYKSMYEHHKKDADGNTIPHEHEEELDEGKIPAGLQSYLDKKKGKKEDKKEMKEGMGLYANIHAKRKRGGKMRKKGDKGAPSSQDFANASKTAKEEVEVDKMKDQIKARRTEQSNLKDDKRERLKKVMKDFGEGADFFDIISTYFIEEGYDRKDVYAAMSSVDLSEEVQDLHEVGFLAALGKVGTALGKAGAAAGKGLKSMKTGASNLMSKVKPSPSGRDFVTAKVTSSGGEIEQGGAPTGLLGKAKKFVKDNPLTSYTVARDLTSGRGGGQQPMSRKTSSISASADLFDIVKGQLIDEGLSEEEIKDIMLTLTPDEIIKEIEESSMSAGSAGGHYHDGGDGVFRSKQQIGNMFNKNIPTKKQTGGKVDKMTRKSINTSARELGIQGPTTLKQSVEPKGNTI